MSPGNPVFRDSSFPSDPAAAKRAMTLEGTLAKTTVSVLLTLVAAYVAWIRAIPPQIFMPLGIITLVLLILIVWKNHLAPFLTPVYAVCKGAILGSISLAAETQFPGIVWHAVILTVAVLFVMLVAWRMGWIRATHRFRTTVLSITGAIFIVYLINFVLSFFGIRVPYLNDATPIGIGISLFTATMAALNLVLDFDFIERTVRTKKSPKYLEWYAAFGFLITLVWLYVEILRLLQKFGRRGALYGGR